MVSGKLPPSPIYFGLSFTVQPPISPYPTHEFVDACRICIYGYLVCLFGREVFFVPCTPYWLSVLELFNGENKNIFGKYLEVSFRYHYLCGTKTKL